MGIFLFVFQFEAKKHTSEIKVTSYSLPQVCYSQLSEMNKPKLPSKFVLAQSLPYELGTFPSFLIRPGAVSNKAISAQSAPFPPHLPAATHISIGQNIPKNPLGC